MRSLQFATKRKVSVLLRLLRSGRWAPCLPDTDGSIVTSSITLYKSTRYEEEGNICLFTKPNVAF